MPPSGAEQCPNDGQALAAKEGFDLREVSRLFRLCREQDGGIQLASYILAFQELNKFFLLLGRIFYFVSKEIMDKTRTLSEHLSSEVGCHYVSVQSMLQYEVGAGLVRTYYSGCTTLLRLHRALQFVASFIEAIRMSDSDQIAPLARKAYDDTLGRYHGWLIRKAVHLAVYTLPTRKQLMSHLSDRMAETETEQIMREVVVECTAVFERVDQLYLEKQLLDIP
uniref:GLTP domain-containing protein n=1 Tax=Trichuris muris TaxID=70415 RepID=A0A5S6QXP8_TRIMR